jgi:hypothetical protein
MSKPEDPQEREERSARNEILFREINERVRELHAASNQTTPVDDWFCECANDRCVERLTMSAEEYEAIRRNPKCFLVAPSLEHFWPELERVKRRDDRYWVVEKTGRVGALAQRADPRSHEGPLPLRT